MDEAPFQYPGSRVLAEVVAATQSLEAGPTSGDLARWVGRLREASSMGLSLEGWKEAAWTFFLLVQDAIDREGRQLGLPEALVDTAMEAANRVFMPIVPLLAPDALKQAWNLMDLLHANRVRRHFLESTVLAAEEFARTAPVPPIRSSLQRLRRAIEMGPRDERLPPLVDLLDRWSDSEGDLAYVNEIRSGIEVRYLVAASRATGILLDDLKRVWVLHEEFTEALGGECVANDVAAGSTRATSEMREATRLLTSRILAVRTEMLSRDPFLEDWMEYEVARIEAGTGSPQSAWRILDRLLERGVFPIECAMLRARLSLVKRYPEDARAAIEKAAAVLPLVRRDDPLQEPLRALYREAGGDPSTLGLAEPPQAFVERAQSNREELAARPVDGMEARAQEALDRFWAQRRTRLDALLGGLLEGGDLDAAIQGGGTREVRLAAEDAAGCALPELPGPPEGLRRLLLAAVRHPVPAHAVASEFLAWLGQREDDWETFEELVSRFPAYGQSVAVAHRRLDAALASGNVGSVMALIDHYESLHGVPDRLLLEVWERARGVVKAGPRWLENVRRGRRIWTRLRGDAGRRCGELVREDAFCSLQDESARGAWEELCQAILDTIPDDDARARLCEWFVATFEGREPSDALLRLGGLLARRLGPPFDARVRGLVKQAVRHSIGSLLRGGRSAEERDAIERLLDVTGGDPDVQVAIAEWYMTWRRGESSGPEAEAFLGEWLSSRLSGEASVRVRHRTGQHLLTMLQASPDTQTQVAVMERLNTLQPGNPEIVRMLKEVRRTAASYRRIFAYILMGAGVAVVLLWLLWRR